MEWILRRNKMILSVKSKLNIISQNLVQKDNLITYDCTAKKLKNLALRFSIKPRQSGVFSFIFVL